MKLHLIYQQKRAIKGNKLNLNDIHLLVMSFGNELIILVCTILLSCFAGYRQPEPDVDICNDINECTQRLHHCAVEEGAVCRNTKGNYTCECPKGFETHNWIHCKGKLMKTAMISNIEEQVMRCMSTRNRQ